MRSIIYSFKALPMVWVFYVCLLLAFATWKLKQSSFYQW